MELNSRLMSSFLAGALLVGPAGAAEGTLQAKMEFKILSYEEKTNYGPMVSRLTTLFQGELGETLAGQEFEISKDENVIRVVVGTQSTDLQGLKVKVRDMATSLPDETLKTQLALVRLEMSSSRKDQEAVPDSTTPPAGPVRSGGDEAAAPEEGVAAQEAQSPRTMKLELESDPAKSAEKPHFKRIFAQDVPLQKLIWVLANEKQLNFVVRPEAALRPVNVHLVDVGLDIVLKALAESARVDIIRREAYYVVGGGLQP